MINMTIENIRAFLDKNKHKRQVNRIQFGYPSIHYYQETQLPIAELLHQRKDRIKSAPNKFHLYVGTPYCIRTDPEKCGYCLFPVEVFAGMKQLDTYLTYLEREGEMYRDYFEGTRLSSIFFGGGTSNLYKAEQYPKLMEMVRRVFPDLEANCTITMEGIPQLYTKEKIEVMKELGVNRISMGVQQMDDELNKLSGRQQRLEHTLRAIEWCQELGLQCNADLIFGWPRQTCDSMLKGLERLIETGITYITHYELNIGGPSDFALNRRDELPSIEENLEMYRASKQLLEENGFRQLTTYNFEKPLQKESQHYDFEECARGFELTENWGWGFAGISRFPGRVSPGWAYINHAKVNDYFAALDKGEYPIARGFHYDIPDLKLLAIFSNLIAMELNRNEYQAVFKTDLLEEYSPIWEALEERQWAEISPEKIKLEGDGVYYTPVISTLLALSRNEQLKDALLATK